MVYLSRVGVFLLFFIFPADSFHTKPITSSLSLVLTSAEHGFLKGGGGGDGGKGEIPRLFLSAGDSHNDNLHGNNDEQENNIVANMMNQKYASGFTVLLTSLLDQYSALLSSSPYKTKMISSGIIGTVGDILIQKLENKSNRDFSLDFRRSAVFFFVSTFYIAPMIHIWFEFLNYFTAVAIPSKFGKLATAALMMIFDQTVGAVAVCFGFFYAFEFFNAYLPGATRRTESFLKLANNAVRSNFQKTIIGNWSCWPAINFINFLFIPHKFRVLFSNFAAIFWNMFLSQVANTKTQ